VEKGNIAKGCENCIDIINGESSPSSFEANINQTKKRSLKRNQLRRVPEVPHTHTHLNHLLCEQSGSKPSMPFLRSLQRWAQDIQFLEKVPKEDRLKP